VPLVLDNVTVRLGGRAVLDGVSVEVGEGITGIIGPNGSGKSSLMRALGGMVPFEGRISLDGVSLMDRNRRDWFKLVSLMPQSVRFDQPFTVRQAVLMGLYPLLGPFKPYGRREEAMADRVIREVGLEDLADRRVWDLSGGEAARVALARSMARDPRLLLLDEPTAALDPRHAMEVMDLLDRGWRGRYGLVVLHDVNLAMSWCSRVLVMRGGRVIASMDRGRPDLKALREAYQVEFVRLQGPRGTVAVMPVRS
jgi:iron complex transport system ATP-binding protein